MWESFAGGRKFLYANEADFLLSLARMAASLFTLVLALLVFQATDQMFGRGPAFLALGLFIFEPDLLGHGALVTTDMGLACCLFAAVFAFYRYVRQPTLLRLIECGFATGLVLAVKHSGVLIFPILGLLALVELWISRRTSAGSASEPERKTESILRRGLRLATALLLFALIAVVVLWGFYGFRFRARPNGLKMEPPLTEFVKESMNQVKFRAITTAERWRALPESYLYGLGYVMLAEERPTFLFGKVYPSGRWFYFPAAFLVKSTLAFLLLLALVPMAKALRRVEVRREVLFLTLPPTLFLIVSLTSGLNIGLRHILPIYPFLLIVAAASAWSLAKRGRRWAYVVGLLILFHVTSSLRAFPNYLAYSSEIWGGPANTYKFLADSSVDWGQGLKGAKRYLDQRRVADCWLAYFGTVDPTYYQLPCRLLPTAFGGVWEKPPQIIPQVIEGTVLVSATEMSGQFWGPGEMNPYEQFFRTSPVDNIGGSILVYRGRFEVPLLCAESHVIRGWEFSGSNRLDQALAEARTAVALAPRSIDSYYLLGYVLKQSHKSAEARQAFQAALALAQTIQPEFNQYTVVFLKKELSGL